VLILTGPSHVGKSTVIEELVSRIPELVVITYDQIFVDILDATRDSMDPDADDFELAFDMLHGVVAPLVAHDRRVLVESTFTRISEEGKVVSSFPARLQQLLKLKPGKAVAVQLFAPWETIRGRWEKGRAKYDGLPEWVVEGTWRAHSEPWPGCSRVSADEQPSAIVDRITALMVE
jgi:hypothetical protein